jgi:hypothetical protein
MGTYLAQFHVADMPAKSIEIGGGFVKEESAGALSLNIYFNTLSQPHLAHPMLKVATFRRERVSNLA